MTSADEVTYWQSVSDIVCVLRNTHLLNVKVHNVVIKSVIYIIMSTLTNSFHILLNKLYKFAEFSICNCLSITGIARDFCLKGLSIACLCFPPNFTNTCCYRNTMKS